MNKIIECPEIEQWDLSDVYCDTDEFMQFENEVNNYE